jgi:peptidoglycan/xylan/chitin deacetylase (PgdA/CDA1 family)
MNWKRAAARTISEIAALPARGRFRHGFRILLYHSVGTRLAHDTYGLSISPALFERHVEILASTPCIKTDAFDSQQFPSDHLQVAVTLDDGYKDSLYTAAPILLKYGIHFTVFVISAFVRDDSREYLTPSELRELAVLPTVTIGSHGATHRPLADCDDQTLRRELYGSRSRLEDITGKPVPFLSYPYGSVDRRVREAAARAGYVRGGCSSFGINARSRDPLLLRRCEIVSSDSERLFLQKLGGAWDWSRWRKQNTSTAFF